LLSLSRVDFDYGRERLLRDVTLDLEPGEKAALVGINGSGKSTLFRILMGELSVDSGERHVQRNARIAILPQETRAEGDGSVLEWVSSSQRELDGVRESLERAESRLASGETLSDGELETYGDMQHRFEQLGGYEHESRVRGTLAGLGFSDEDVQKPLRVLSGGERRRAALAAVLLQGADLLLLDEPTNHLDLDALEWLQGFVRDSSSAMLIVSHDRYFLDHTVQTVWHLSRATTMRWPGNYTQFKQAYEEWVRTEEAAYTKQQHEIRKTEEFIRRNIAGQKTRQAQGRRKVLSRMERLERPRQEQTRFRLRLQSKERGGNLVLAARGITQQFEERTLFSDLDFDLSRGDRVGIVGPNGAGKTTLLKILAGRITPTAGTVRLGSGIDMGYFDQELDFVGDAPSLLEEIWRVDVSNKEEDVRGFLGAFGFGEDYVDRPVRVLSGGQRSRLGLLKMVLERHNLLVLDEPTNHLDLDSVGFLEEGLRDYDGTLLLVSHDRTLLSRAVDTLLVLNGGMARVFHGGYEDYVESLGGQALWSEMESLEAQRVMSEDTLSRSTKAPRRKRERTSNEQKKSPTVDPEPQKVSKNSIARLRKRLAALEDEIVVVEVDIEEIEEQLAKAGQLGSERIRELSRAHAAKKQELDTLYGSWEEMSQEHETLGKRLDEQSRRKKR
jgi:ATP-binding cassette subfamily F protein 3